MSSNIREITFKTSLDDAMMTDDFIWYISKRNEELDLAHYQKFAV